jgi:hypothetical protein
MFFAKVKLGTAAVLCALLATLIAGSFTSLGFAQDAKPKPRPGEAASPSGKTESDLEFIRRISKDLRGSEPTLAEIHFFVASKEAGKRQKLIDLFIQERQASKEAESSVLLHRAALAQLRIRRFQLALKTPPRLSTLQRQFYQDLHTAREKGDIARITQAYLDHLIDYVKANPKSQDIPDAIGQIVLVYESQGKAVEADAWRAKLPKEAQKTSLGRDLGITK